jgi:4-amino-4-deoxy-L-arabinose transferase-like glycosyltransferase
MTPSEKKITILVLGLVAVLFLAFLSAVGFFDPEEGRHVSIPVAMLRTGDFVVPHLQGFPYLEKPPLAYWMTAASFGLFGRNEVAGRLPVALMGYAGTLAIFWLAWRRLGPRVAWIAALLMALTSPWFAGARYMTTDMILAGWMTVALTAFFLAASSGRRSLYWVFYMALALATLSKGIIGFVLPGMIVGLFIALTGRWRILREMHLTPGTILFAAIVLPWFFLVQARLPDFFRYFIFDQHISRYTATHAEHSKPFWYFTPLMALGFFPWTVYLPFLRNWKRMDGEGTAASADPTSGPDGRDGSASSRVSRWAPLAGARSLHIFLLIWFGVIFLFFSASKGKLPAYVLPAYPPLTILVAELFARLWDGRVLQDAARRVRTASFVVAAVLLVLAPAFFFGIRAFAARDGRMSAEEIAIWPWAFGALFALGGLTLLFFAWRRHPRAAFVTQVVVQFLFLFILIGGLRAVEPDLGPRTLGRALAAVVEPEDLVVLYKLQQPSLEYYLGRPPMLVAWRGEYRYGMKIQPDTELFSPDAEEIKRLLAGDRTVYVVVKQEDDSVPEAFGVPVRLVAENRKRAIYRNHPEDDGPGAGAGPAAKRQGNR